MYLNCFRFLAGLLGLLLVMVCISPAESRAAGPPFTRLDPFGPLLEGDNICYMVQAYFPKEALAALLPDRLTIPDDATMARQYPGTKLKADEHPFMISLCRGLNIHDVLTNINVPEQEEIMFLFPVMYTDDAGEEHLCSYVPVLYLDSFWGVVGGLFYGFRKEFHPEMQYEEDADSKWWTVGDFFAASFVRQADEPLEELPGFFKQTYANPYVTVSYPLPFPRMVFFQVKVYPEAVSMAGETFEWQYRGTRVQDDGDTLSAYSEYRFTLSWPMRAGKYFGTP